MVGLAVSYSLGDEGAYSSSGAYGERKQVTLPDAIEFWGGVPRAGEQGMFKIIADRTRAVMESGGTPQWSLHGNPPNPNSPLWKSPKRYSYVRQHPVPLERSGTGAAWHGQLGLGHCADADMRLGRGGGRDGFPGGADCADPVLCGLAVGQRCDDGGGGEYLVWDRVESGTGRRVVYNLRLRL